MLMIMVDYFDDKFIAIKNVSNGSSTQNGKLMMVSQYS